MLFSFMLAEMCDNYLLPKEISLTKMKGAAHFISVNIAFLYLCFIHIDRDVT